MKDFILGIIMGIAELLPGISGGTIAAISGRYEIILKAASDIVSLKWTKESLKIITFLIIGMGMSIILLSKVLSYLFNKYPEYSYGIFAGLIIGGLIYLLNQIDFKKKSNLSIITITFFIAFLLLNFAKSIESTTGNINFWYLMFGGVVAVSVMVLPGVSGSSMLLIMGLYKPVINAVSNMNFNILIPVAIGIFLGLIFIIKLLEGLMEKFREHVMSFLIGLTLAGMVTIFPITSKWLTYIFFIIGIFLSHYLEKILKE
ncbi:putative membrane protein [Marinitoga hydrogenitolerans DSM 16785]|uniref:Membrane protein n=1 Tax=Marinitoga hydrogenitolerans (strain DSM 16785 / JCM 12826 / AT1271) TaxID=1122195 RepID=A0A1M4T4B2_MARH1|nr:DUF368 domain-containing protein [Marinitoga hydrogenitolerans]SHE39188.1 putative membrane protein [Marinitoga hydrogenitolerans DSM 16785]